MTSGAVAADMPVDPAVAAGGSPLDPVRLRAERHRRLLAAMDQAGVDVAVLTGTSNVAYASGARLAPVDGATAALLRPVAVVIAGQDHPHLFAPLPGMAPPELPEDHRHGGWWTGTAPGTDAAAAMVADLAGGVPRRLAVDEWSGALGHGTTTGEPLAGFGASELVDAGALLHGIRLHKTADEVECIRRAQRINELAMLDVEALLGPGVRQSELTGRFLRRVLELGADGWALDPIWQVVPDGAEPAVATVHGQLGFPLASTDRILRRGDVVWVDTGVPYLGYASDFGRTWVVGPGTPPPALRDAHRRWRDIVQAVRAEIRPGADGATLVAVARHAAGGRTPWPPHFYLAHGIGLDSAEAPLIGTDRGPAADAAVVLEPGMVVVLEPETWVAGSGGYRGEEVLVVTDDGHRMLSDHHDWPFA